MNKVNVVVTIDDVKGRRRIPSGVGLQVPVIFVEDYVLALVVLLNFVNLFIKTCVFFFLTLL